MFSSPYHVHFLSLLFALAAVLSAHAVSDGVEFTVASVDSNTVGGQLFNKEMGVEYAERLMGSITNQIWKLLFRRAIPIWEKVRKISLVIDQTTKVSSRHHDTGYTYEISLNSKHIEKCKDFVHDEIHMLLIYEIAQVLQYKADDHIHAAYRDGIAAYMVIHLGHAPSRWAKFGGGDTWDQSADVTGQFFYYCSDVYDDFIKNLNKEIQTSCKDCFSYLTGQKIHDVWNEYKFKYSLKARCVLC